MGQNELNGYPEDDDETDGSKDCFPESKHTYFSKLSTVSI
jgi:hypothetical protein